MGNHGKPSVTIMPSAVSFFHEMSQFILCALDLFIYDTISFIVVLIETEPGVITRIDFELRID